MNIVRILVVPCLVTAALATVVVAFGSVGAGASQIPSQPVAAQVTAGIADADAPLVGAARLWLAQSCSDCGNGPSDPRVP